MAEITLVRSESRPFGGGPGSPPTYVTVYFPTVAFTGPDGRAVEAESRCHYGEADRPGEGARVEVFYSRADPEDVCVADAIDENRPGAVATLALISGMFATGAGIVLAICLFLWSVHALSLGDDYMRWP